MAVCLVADRLSELNDRLVASAHVAAIEVPLPEADHRREFCRRLIRSGNLGANAPEQLDQLVEVSNGLSLVDLNVVLSQGARGAQEVDLARFRQLKKTMIERQCRGLVEFIEPAHTLDMVVGFDEAKRRLREDAQRLSRGLLDTAPMGYLICGPVGTGKTFLAECYAGSIGIPCVVMKNFRSKYVGETEANLEQVLSVLRSLGPVVVIVDEADAALGSRQAEGDSGTSARVFSMIASQMGNTRFRGKIIWMLLTSPPRPAPDRSQTPGPRRGPHPPLLSPHRRIDSHHVSGARQKEQGGIGARRAAPRLRRAPIDGSRHREYRPGGPARRLVRRAHRRLCADLDGALAEFIPSAQGLEKELQELAAVLECTQLSFLPPEWREKVTAPDGRTRLQERMVAIRQLIEQ